MTIKIKSIEACRVNLTPKHPKTPPRRPSYNKSAKRAFPINKYPEFPRNLHNIPGEVGPELWVKVTAENGVWGIGVCNWANLVTPLIRDHFAPLLVGREYGDGRVLAFATDSTWRWVMQGAGEQHRRCRTFPFSSFWPEVPFYLGPFSFFFF